MISIYLIGKLPRSDGYSFILSIVDVATKFVMLYALKQATTKKILKEYFKLSGMPNKILSDNGSQFI